MGNAAGGGWGGNKTKAFFMPPTFFFYGRTWDVSSSVPVYTTLFFLAAKKAGSSALQIWEIACKNGRGIFFCRPRVYTCIEAIRGEVKVEDTSEIDLYYVFEPSHRHTENCLSHLDDPLSYLECGKKL